LWDLIVNTHSILGGGQAKSMIPGEIDRELMENLDGVKMSAMESLSTYLKRLRFSISSRSISPGIMDLACPPPNIEWVLTIKSHNFFFHLHQCIFC
jgi:hypothetical protein